MVTIILAASAETKRKALRSGYVEQTILIKSDSVESTEANKVKLEGDCRKLKPYQFLVADYWGMCSPD